MENINHDIACEVSSCKFNHAGCNCTLGHIKVGCSCGRSDCTCCESYSEKV